MLTTTRLVSSSCTGALTAEMGLAVFEKTVNDSGVLRPLVSFQSVSTHDDNLAKQKLKSFILFANAKCNVADAIR